MAFNFQPPELDSIETLLERARNQDKTAAVELLQRFAPEFLHTIRKFIPKRLRRHGYDSEVLVQDMYVAVLSCRCHDAFDSVQTFRAYMNKVAQNTVLFAVRKEFGTQCRDRTREVALESISEQEEPLAFDPSILRQMIKDEAWELALQKCLPVDRLIMKLLLEGHTYQQIAFVLNQSERYVRRALDKLAELHHELLQDALNPA